jgi:hypothetical protein
LPPPGSRRDRCGRLVKVNDSFHMQIIAHPDLPLPPTGRLGADD